MRRFARCHHAGFTLLEVLVALAILAIALLAAMRVAAQGTDDAADLRIRLLASWVAANILAEHAARGDWLPPGSASGRERQGREQFVWREVVTATPNQSFRRVDVLVYAPPGETRVVARLSGTLVRPAGDGR